MGTMRSICCAIALFTALFAVSAVVALAVAPYDHATPGPGAVLQAFPQRIDVYTKVPTSAVPGDTQMLVTDANQQRADAGILTVDPSDHHHFSVDLRHGLTLGRYIVSFKTVGEDDGDHDGGQFAFYVGVQPSKADRAADRALSLTTTGGDLTPTGYRRGLIEGIPPFVIGIPVIVYFWQRRKRREAAASASGAPVSREIE